MKRMVVFNPSSVREARKYLQPPLARVSKVVYYAGETVIPQSLDRGDDRVTPSRERRLTGTSEITKEMLGRIVVFTDQVCPPQDALVPDVPEKFRRA